jgi:hypothetical protein
MVPDPENMKGVPVADKTPTRYVGTRFRIQDEVEIREAWTRDLDEFYGDQRWAIGSRGLLRSVHFDLGGVAFFVEVVDVFKRCRLVKCRRIRKVREGE